MIRYKHLHILGGKGQKDLQQNQNISMRWNISFQWRLLQVAMLKKEARIKANAEICSVISVPASSAPICSWKLSLRRSPENQRQLDAQMQPLIAKWQRMTKRSGSYDNVVRSCSPDGSPACTSTPTSLPPCVSVHRGPPKTWNGNTTPPRPSSSTRWLETEMQLAHCSTGAGCCSSRSLSRSQPAAGLCCWVSPWRGKLSGT